MTKPISADGTTFTFGGVVVGGITAYTLIDGVTGDIVHVPLNGEGRHYFPAVPEYGQIRLTLYRNTSDAGQQAMEQARANRQRAQCVLTLIDGTTRTFLGYVKTLPMLNGDINGVNGVQATLKVAGPVS